MDSEVRNQAGMADWSILSALVEGNERIGIVVLQKGIIVSKIWTLMAAMMII